MHLYLQLLHHLIQNWIKEISFKRQYPIVNLTLKNLILSTLKLFLNLVKSLISYGLLWLLIFHSQTNDVLMLLRSKDVFIHQATIIQLINLINSKKIIYLHHWIPMTFFFTYPWVPQSLFWIIQQFYGIEVSYA